MALVVSVTSPESSSLTGFQTHDSIATPLWQSLNVRGQCSVRNFFLSRFFWPACIVVQERILRARRESHAVNGT